MTRPTVAVTTSTQSTEPVSVVSPKTTLAPMIPAPAAASDSPTFFSSLGAIGISLRSPLPESWWTTDASGTRVDRPPAIRTFSRRAVADPCTGPMDFRFPGCRWLVVCALEMRRRHAVGRRARRELPAHADGNAVRDVRHRELAEHRPEEIRRPPLGTDLLREQGGRDGG